MSLQTDKNKVLRTNSINTILNMAKKHQMPNIPKNPKSIERLRTRVVNHIEKIQYVDNDYYERAGENSGVSKEQRENNKKINQYLKQMNEIKKEADKLGISYDDLDEVGKHLNKGYNNKNKLKKNINHVYLEQPDYLLKMLERNTSRDYVDKILSDTKGYLTPEEIEKFTNDFNNASLVKKMIIRNRFFDKFSLYYESMTDSLQSPGEKKQAIIDSIYGAFDGYTSVKNKFK